MDGGVVLELGACTDIDRVCHRHFSPKIGPVDELGDSRKIGLTLNNGTLISRLFFLPLLVTF